MARAHASQHGADDWQRRGATESAPRLTPLRLAQTAVAAIAELIAGSVGADFSNGAVAIGALLAPGESFDTRQQVTGGVLVHADAAHLLYLVALTADGESEPAAALLARLREAGLEAVSSAPRRSAAEVELALREATILLRLLADPKATLHAHEPTYRLLIGVLLRDRGELISLRDSTVAALERYDRGHDTHLVGTLETFLANHGSTTDTAEAMGLHRHTVGYRLARVLEVCGLSPYESEGRERLSLGLKAKRILLADRGDEASP